MLLYCRIQIWGLHETANAFGSSCSAFAGGIRGSSAGICVGEKMKEKAAVLLRIGLSLVFLWFGFNQLLFPESFLGYLPEWVMGHARDSIPHYMMVMMSYLPENLSILIIVNGIFEITFGTLLLLGVFTRISSLVLAAHLAFIAVSLGYNDVAVRDFGLVIAALSVFLHGPDEKSLDRKLKIRIPKILKPLYFFDDKLK